ncbi:sodium/proton antiporter, NhaA family (TC 2.A.33.1.1) [Tessaracoccus bendigoensis DSM 12906]|uniref:Na(+)/H(+) antiporter NhaA n=1 Tax=Tessaracoccus bendigoensis DSM 12906 TaxID=1123357 RepID=A0A1M6HXK0_9ACTN|nr:Na+/H+ antiporter NhaA [Tessaracoccus bendigoensis]SHJ26878.1 sodium/proton antiporter, NhaA family (TC 2.A.33.1.1) [Tessaracoccus bendigoensis DSM 12906]
MTTRTTRLRALVASDSVAGLLLMGAAVIGLLWANSPWRHVYVNLSELTVGPAALHLDLSLSSWAADGLLAVFFLVVGLELKYEIVLGSLRNPRQAAVPVLAAVGGMVTPALVFVGVIAATGATEALRGWAIPTATDIAFALAVLAIFGRGLPRALRVFLLTLAVVDDLLAIIVIAAFYTESLTPAWLLVALGCVAGFALLVRLPRLRWWLLIPLGLLAWGFMHASGVHATIAGVLLGLAVPARPVHGEKGSRVHRFTAAVQPVSAAIVVPIFAFFSAGVSLVDGAGPLAVLRQPVFLAIIAGLMVGKVVGVLGTTALVTRLTPLRLPDAIGLRDLFPVGLLTGIGFTVSLLIAELSFPAGDMAAAAKVAVLAGSVGSAVLGGVALRWAARRPRSDDMNLDGVTDVDTDRIA